MAVLPLPAARRYGRPSDHDSLSATGQGPRYPSTVSLEIDRLTKRYGATLALDAIQFSVPRGQVFGFLGANGAGKTTTMRICGRPSPAPRNEKRGTLSTRALSGGCQTCNLLRPARGT